MVVVEQALICTRKRNGLGQLLWASNSTRVDKLFLELDSYLHLVDVGMVGSVIALVVLGFGSLVGRLDCITIHNGLD
jgi:predicted small integral membrane protein